MTRAPQPARRLLVPEGFLLRDEEIRALLDAANERVARDEPGFRVEDVDATWYEIRVPRTAAIARGDLVSLLNFLNRALEARHSDALVTIVDGKVTRRWLTIKDALHRGDDGVTMPLVGGVQVKREF